MPALVPVTLAASVGKVVLSSLASGHADGTSGTSSANAKKTGSHESSTDATSSTTGFAALLAAAITPTPVLPLAAASMTLSSGVKGSTNSVKTGQPVGAVGSAAAGGLGTIGIASTAAATIKPATPTPTAAGSVSLAASGIRPGSSVQKSTGPSGTVPTPAAPRQTAPGTIAPPVLPAGHEQPGVGDAAPSLLNLSAPALSGNLEDSRVSLASTPAAAAVPPAAASSAALTEVKNNLPASSSIQGVRGLALPQMAQAESTVLASQNHPLPAWVNPPPPGPHHDAPRRTDAPPPSAPTDPTVAGPIAAPATTPQAPDGPAQQAPPVADQLTQAFVAHADIARTDGRVDFHLRLDPPQLGTVQIHLTATDHTISARVVVAQEATRQLLDGQAHHLRQSLAQAGLSLTGFDVSRDGGGWRGGQQQQQPTPLPLSLTSAPASVRPALAPGLPARIARSGIDLLA
jgi:hypothetical protein